MPVPIVITSITSQLTITVSYGEQSTDGLRFQPPADGFDLTWTEVPQLLPAPQCVGGLVLNATATQQTISDGFPGPLGASNCEFLLQAPPGAFVELDFTEFDIADKSVDVAKANFLECRTDFLEVRDGALAASPVLLRGCGTSLLEEVVVSTGNALLVTFVSRANQFKTGFRANFRTVDVAGLPPVHCVNGSVTALNASVPGTVEEPANYEARTTCEWVVRAPSDQVVRIDFDFFQLEPRLFTCAFDRLEVRDGATASAPLLAVLCDALSPVGPLESTGSALRIKFASDATEAAEGFNLNFAAVSATPRPACNTTVAGNVSDTFLLSDGSRRGQAYLPSFGCSWTVVGVPGTFVQLTYLFFNLESTVGCVTDRVRVRDGSTNTLLQAACGVSLPPPVVSLDNSLVVEFLSSGTNFGGDGFLIQVDFLQDPPDHFLTQCQGTALITAEFVGQTDIVTDGADGHALVADCTFNLTAPEGTFFKLEFIRRDFSVQAENINCGLEFITVTDGDGYPMLAKSCGALVTSAPMFTFTNRMTIHYVTDASINGGGFAARWEVVAETSSVGRHCFGQAIQTGLSGTIQSNDPTVERARYADGVPCSFLITVGAGQFVNLEFTSVNMRMAINPCRDSITVRDGPFTSSPILLQFCQSDLIALPAVIGTSASMLVQFTSSALDPAAQGWSANWAAGGGQFRCAAQTLVLTEPGEFQSSNFLYNANQRCQWLLRPPPGLVVRLTFTRLAVEPHPVCDFDVVEIFDGSSASDRLIGRVCGAQLPSPFVASGPMFVAFSSDSLVQFRGFAAVWEIITPIPTPPSAAFPTAAPLQSQGNQAGALLGAVVGTVLVVMAIVLCCVVWTKRQAAAEDAAALARQRAPAKAAEPVQSPIDELARARIEIFGNKQTHRDTALSEPNIITGEAPPAYAGVEKHAVFECEDLSSSGDEADPNADTAAGRPQQVTCVVSYQQAELPLDPLAQPRNVASDLV